MKEVVQYLEKSEHEKSKIQFDSFIIHEFLSMELPQHKGIDFYF